ncbi:YdiU family protein [Gluconacetobacter azotocaptans]|uniref:protein adenylyltransferase SelO n=1 Tax=Gluconacetobacter azotocaptans TaxID=142834 RepID=UPI001959623B|nr:YdiU family protein [Gluconacetobacter azotocaptans]MBM9400436.1 YdiU family protein [Gluconacetobacter azotocaptans]
MQLANHYATLPPRFFARMDPSALSAPRLLKLNEGLARDLGLDPDWLAGPEGVALLAGSAFPPGVTPIATAYAGHQFGQFVPVLGDGRALLLGDGVDVHGRPYEIQLKGSGPTPFSRRGDGRAALGPVLREYLVSEAMAALGVPTTRTLAAVATGESVIRDTLRPGAVLARVASSHIRVGSFQYFAARQDEEGLRALADFAIARHYPDLVGREDRYLAFFDAVVGAQAELIARWMSLGFIHGVMNTDNMTVSGETIDYGPCAFLDEYNPAKVFSSIDQGGRYAYANQPQIAMWNLARLAETLVPLIDADPQAAVDRLQPVLMTFRERYEKAADVLMHRKLGLETDEPDDRRLISDWLDLLRVASADFTWSFRRLADPEPDFPDLDGFAAWRARWDARLASEGCAPSDARVKMRRVNPAVIPRNHRIEAVIEAAEKGDFGPFEALLAAVTTPFADDPDYERPPLVAERVRATFCGT